MESQRKVQGIQKTRVCYLLGAEKEAKVTEIKRGCRELEDRDSLPHSKDNVNPQQEKQNAMVRYAF